MAISQVSAEGDLVPVNLSPGELIIPPGALIPFDLTPPSKILVPVFTPLPLFTSHDSAPMLMNIISEKEDPWDVWLISDEVTHMCPVTSGDAMPCCGLTPYEVPRWHRLTLDKELVTCDGSS